MTADLQRPFTIADEVRQRRYQHINGVHTHCDRSTCSWWQAELDQPVAIERSQ